jgi:hypothetical protein
MKLNKPSLTQPRQPKEGVGVLHWAKDVNYAIKQLSQYNLDSQRQLRGVSFTSGIKPPFHVSVRKSATDDDPPVDLYYFKVYPGYVYEINPGASDSTLYHQPSNLYSGEDLSEFLISGDEALFIKVELLEDGTIGSDDEELNPSCQIIVLPDTQLSSFYEPRVDDESPNGEKGTMYYKLAAYSEGSSNKIERFLSGSHICHHQDLPAILSTLAVGEGIGVLSQKWDAVNRAYYLRALSEGKGQLGITTNNDHIEVRGNQKKAKITYQVGDDSPVDLVNFVDGLIVDGADEPDPEEPVEAQVFNIEIPDGGGETIHHPWKITRTAENTWLVKGGTIYGHNGEAYPIEVPDTIVTTESGVVILRVERDTTTRQVVAADIITLFGVEPDYDYYQSFALGFVEELGDPQIIQYQFQEIKLFELLIVSNGSFKLGNFQMMGYMNYDLPT